MVIQSQAVWYGKELTSRSDWQFALTDEHVAELQAALAAVTHTATYEITREAFALATLGPQLRAFQDALETGPGLVRISGFPIDRYKPGQANRAYWGMMQHLGTPVSQSATGERLFAVRDAGFADDDRRARGPNTKKRLSFHTDRCDVIGFLCVQPAASGGENFVVSSAALYNTIEHERPDLLEVLKQPYYYQRHTVDTGNDLPYCQQPIFSFCEGHFACSFLRVLIDRAYASGEVPPMSDEQREALDFLEEVAERPSMQVRFFQERGDIVLLNNWATLHRRTEFVDHPDAERKRHLVRIWLSVPNSRPIDPMFEDNFGATEAGALRGGMRAKDR